MTDCCPSVQAATPCAGLATDPSLRAAEIACGTGTPAANPDNPTGIAGILGLLTGACPADATVHHFQRACCTSGWPCTVPTCGSPLDPTSCTGIGLACPAFLADADAQGIMLACSQAECGDSQVSEMQTSCCPGGWVEADGTRGPCVAPVCDADDCNGKLIEMAAMCPVTLTNNDGIAAMLQRCQQAQDAAAAAGLDDASASACLTDQAADIRLMHRTCCPSGWTSNGGGCVPEPANCGQTAVPTDCTGQINALLASGCAALIFDADIQIVATVCATYIASSAAAPCAPGVIAGLVAQQTDCTAFATALTAADPCANLVTDPSLQAVIAACTGVPLTPTATTPAGGRGGTAGRGGAPGGRGGPPPAGRGVGSPPPGGDTPAGDAGDGAGGSVGVLIAGVVLVGGGAGAFAMKSKKAKIGAVDPTDSMYGGDSLPS